MKRSISVNTVEKQISDKKFISVLTYQKGITRNTPKNFSMKRKYPEIFENLGFIRLAGNWAYFIIAEENIFPKKLRTLNNLSKYLLIRAKLVLDTEWEEIISVSKEESPRFYNNRKHQENPLNFNMLIAKTNMRDMRHKFLKSNDFNEKFNLELATLTKSNKLRISNQEKVRIKNFITESSIDIFLESVENEHKRKLLLLEDKFKQPLEDGGLSIINFCDYHKRNRNDIINILLIEFSEKLAKQYTDLIVGYSKEYEDLLLQLGVNI